MVKNNIGLFSGKAIFEYETEEYAK